MTINAITALSSQAMALGIPLSTYLVFLIANNISPQNIATAQINAVNNYIPLKDYSYYLWYSNL